MFAVCRFCLNDDETSLRLITESEDDSLTIEEIELFTGLQLNDEQLYSYAVCSECSKHLEMMGAFRELCLSNEAYFRQIYAMQYTKVELAPMEIELVPNVTLEQESTDDTAMIDDRNRLTPDNISDAEEEKDNFCSILNGIDSEQSFLSKDDDRDDIYEEHSLDSALKLPSKAKRAPAKRQNEYKNTNRSKNANTPRQLCNMCGKMVTNIVLHISSHTNETNYKCPHCPTKMTHPANLMRHIKAVHLKTIIKSCDLCGKGFTHKNTYKSHMRSQHNMGESFKCEICSKLFKHPSGLREHVIRFHTSESNYECVVCEKMFKTKQALKEHEKVHTDEKPHCCKHCQKQFKSRSARNAHQLTHSGIVFTCMYCDKSYRYKTVLNIHVRKCHQFSIGISEYDRD